MKRPARLHRHSFVACALVLLASALPAVASALPITLSGSVADVQDLPGTSPFSVGDALTGSFDVDVDSDNRFSVGNLNSFNLTIGPAMFALDGSDFGSFDGTLSDDGTTLTEFSLASVFVTVPGLDGTFALGFDGVNQPFSVNAITSIATGPFSAAVGVTPVPEPSALLLFGCAVLGAGLTVRRRGAQR